MTSRLCRTVCLAAGLAGLAACAGATIVYPPSYGRYSANLFAYAAGDRDLLVEIRGNPSGLPDPVFRQTLVDAMQGTKPGARTHFTLAPGPSARAGYRIVLLFDAASSASGAASCKGLHAPPVVTGTPAGRPLAVAATFCAGDESLSDLAASGPVLGADVRGQLASFMGSVIPSLMPVENPLLLNAADDFPG